MTLVERLRAYAKDQGGWHNIDETCEEAADRIEALEAELSKAREAALEEASKVAECHFDERGNGRSGHHSEMDWTDGYRDATRGAGRAIRSLSHKEG